MNPIDLRVLKFKPAGAHLLVAATAILAAVGASLVVSSATQAQTVDAEQVLSRSIHLRADGETLRGRVGEDLIEIHPLPASVHAQKDLRIRMPDGMEISANLYRPVGALDERLPVILALTSYDKDLRPEDYLINGRAPVNRLQGQRFGNFKVSEATPFEAPDPAWWVPKGYALMHVDARGTGLSGGKKDVLSDQTIDDFARVVTWASEQPWSNGKVGLAGTSYLALVQWLVAERGPKGLAAIAPWEGMTDPYRDTSFHGGIPETAFVRSWLQGPGAPMGTTDPPKFLKRKPWIGHLPIPGTAGARLRYFAGLNPTPREMGTPSVQLSQITVPALVTGSWSAQGLHTRGAFNGFMGIGSTQKWLYTHGRHMWDVMKSEEALVVQLGFFDRFLKEDPRAFQNQPRVRLEVRHGENRHSVRAENAWPLERTQYTALHLDALSGQLSAQPRVDPAMTQYNSTLEDSVVFKHTFDRDTEITGHTKLKLWVSMDAGLDMDLFVGLRKRNARGDLERFDNHHQFYPVVSRGWLRVSQRKLDPVLSQPWRPYLTHDEPLPVAPGERYPVEIEILPSSTLFEAGSTLELVIQGRDLTQARNQQHKILMNQGRHTVWTGGRFDSHLLLPVIP